jgi:hypothetical protein
MEAKDVQSKDVQAILNILKDKGIEEYEPKVINQLLEFSYSNLKYYRLSKSYIFFVLIRICNNNSRRCSCIFNSCW